jgi:hypothetical protein
MTILFSIKKSCPTGFVASLAMQSSRQAYPTKAWTRFSLRKNHVAGPGEWQAVRLDLAILAADH